MNLWGLTTFRAEFNLPCTCWRRRQSVTQLELKLEEVAMQTLSTCCCPLCWDRRPKSRPALVSGWKSYRLLRPTSWISWGGAKTATCFLSCQSWQRKVSWVLKKHHRTSFPLLREYIAHRTWFPWQHGDKSRLSAIVTGIILNPDFEIFRELWTVGGQMRRSSETSTFWASRDG